MSVTDVDHGYKKALAVLFDKKKPALKVGIFGANAEKSEPGGLTVAEVGAFHEFGLGYNPERSFLRAWCDENEQACMERLHADAELVAAGKLTWEQAMERLGLFMVGGIQQRMAGGIEPPKVDGTPARLIDTGVLRSSIVHEVVHGRSE